jgi:hypothetical protein
MIRPEFMTSETLSSVSLGARLTFAYLLMVSDNSGRFSAGRALLSELFPIDEGVTQNVLEDFLCELETIGSVEFYQEKNKVFGYIPNFKKYQTGLRMTERSIIPDPTEETRIKFIAFVQNRRSKQNCDLGANDTRQARESDASQTQLSTADVTRIDLSTHINEGRGVSIPKMEPVVGEMGSISCLVSEGKSPKLLARPSLREVATRFLGGGKDARTPQ